MRRKINPYGAMLIVTLFSSAMTLLIVDVGTTTIINNVMAQSVANRVALQLSVAEHVRR